MSDAPQNNQMPDKEPRSSSEEEMSVLDLALALVRNRTLIVRTVVIVTLLGLTYSLVASHEYTSQAKVVRETREDAPNLGGVGGLGALRGLGISLGGASSGLTAAAFPEVIQSRSVRLAVARDTFSFPDTEKPMTYIEYVSRGPTLIGLIVKYTIRLPWTIKGAFSNAISGEGPSAVTADSTGANRMLSEEEEKAIKALRRMITANVDEENGLMDITVTAHGPRLAADIAQSFVNHLTDRVRNIRTRKVRERLEFVEGRFEGAEQELKEAEERLATFLERNQNPNSAPLQFQRDRLRRQVQFKEQLFSEMQSQLTQTRLDLQRRQPVVTVVEAPMAPRTRSAPKRMLIVLFSVLIGTLFGLGAALARGFFNMKSAEAEEREKLAEIRETVLSKGIARHFAEYVGIVEQQDKLRSGDT